MNAAKYLFATDDGADGYGLYIMAKECSLHKAGCLTAYFFDADKFFTRPKDVMTSFVPLHELQSCKDEFGNVYVGPELMARVAEAVLAYEEEISGYEEYCEAMDERFNEAETRANEI